MARRAIRCRDCRVVIGHLVPMRAGGVADAIRSMGMEPVKAEWLPNVAQPLPHTHYACNLCAALKPEGAVR